MSRGSTLEDLGDDVLAVVLFGSVATGSNDELSDTDIFVMCRDTIAVSAADNAVAWANVLGVSERNLSIYTEHAVRVMARRGALLLHHLKLEGRVLLDREAAFKSIQIEAFADFATELDLLDALLTDVDRAWKDDRVVTALDLHILQVVVRNASILLTVFHGRPAFGRTSAVSEARRLDSQLPISEDDYRDLVAWHLLHLRGVGNVAPLSKARQRSCFRVAKSVLRHVRSVVC